MGLPEKLLDMLACPRCKEKLTYKEQEDNLVCQSCQVFYHIKDNVPVLLSDEAKKL